MGTRKNKEFSWYIISDGKNKLYQARYAKKDYQILIQKLYYAQNLSCLERKRLKMQKALTELQKSI